MGMIAWIVLGAIAGFVANLVMGGGRQSPLMTVVHGIVGAVVGGFMAGSILNLSDVSGLNVSSIVVAVIVIAVARYALPHGEASAV